MFQPLIINIIGVLLIGQRVGKNNRKEAFFAGIPLE
jgi:hypothetical protein